MKKAFAVCACLLLALSYSEAAQQSRSAASGMSDDELIKTAMSAAPPHISRDAAVVAPGPDGIRTLREGTNEFTCIPDLSGQEVPDPICADRAATAWITSMLNKEEKPANTAPGIAYMGLGGWHWETDGQIVMDPATPGAKRVTEPPHWMLMWPVEPMKTALPVVPSKFGTYIMYAGTPYAHLMIYQDPMKLPQPAAKK